MVPVGPAYLVLNTTFEGPGRLMGTTWNVTQDWMKEKNKEWIHITSTQSDFLTNSSGDPVQFPGSSWSIDASLCYKAGFWTKNIFIEANRTNSNTEPAMMQDGLRQLGVSTTTLLYEEWSILELSEHEVARQLEFEKGIISKDDNYFYSDPRWPQFSLAAVNPYSETLATYQSLRANQLGHGYQQFNITRYLFHSETVVTDSRLSVSKERAELFQQASRSTNSPAKAIQALFHTVMADGFYRCLPYYDVPSDYSASYAVSALQPVRKLGLAIVLTALALHIICVSFITIYQSGILSPGMPPIYA